MCLFLQWQSALFLSIANMSCWDAPPGRSSKVVRVLSPVQAVCNGSFSIRLVHLLGPLAPPRWIMTKCCVPRVHRAQVHVAKKSTGHHYAMKIQYKGELLRSFAHNLSKLDNEKVPCLTQYCCMFLAQNKAISLIRTAVYFWLMLYPFYATVYKQTTPTSILPVRFGAKK